MPRFAIDWSYSGTTYVHAADREAARAAFYAADHKEILVADLSPRADHELAVDNVALDGDDETAFSLEALKAEPAADARPFSMDSVKELGARLREARLGLHPNSEGLAVCSVCSEPLGTDDKNGRCGFDQEDPEGK